MNDWEKLLKTLSAIVAYDSDFMKQERQRQDKVVAEMDYQLKLDVVAWTMRKICEHARDGGTYRYLIYDRMGFEPDAYAVLLEAGGMEINNFFDLQDHE